MSKKERLDKVYNALEALQMIIDVVRHPFHREKVVTECGGASRTHQSHKEACDVNNIIAKFDNTGILPVGKGEGQFVDVTHLQKDLTELHAEAAEVSEAVGAALAKRDLDAKEQEAAKKLAQEKRAQLEKLKSELGELETPSPAPTDGSE